MISISPKVHSPRSAPATDGLYAFERVSSRETTTTSFNGDSRSRETIDECPDAMIQEAYRSPTVPFASSNQIAPLTGNCCSLRGNEQPSFQSPTGNALATRLLPITTTSNDGVIANNTPRSNEYSAPPTPAKPELSHPVSRLCDTIESDEKRETPVVVNAINAAETDGAMEEKITRILVNSDDNNNNNETIIKTEVVSQRGRPVDEHRCDQCGKTFVTRASLKVHEAGINFFHYVTLIDF